MTAEVFTVQLIPSYFQIGPDVIIVWPVASLVSVADSGRAPINIAAPSAITSIYSDGILAFVSGDQLILQNNSAKLLLQQIRIFDLTGKETALYDINSFYSTISLSNLHKGMYVAEIYLSNGETKRIKFIR